VTGFARLFLEHGIGRPNDVCDASSLTIRRSDLRREVTLKNFETACAARASGEPSPTPLEEARSDVSYLILASLSIDYGLAKI
jgi:hypothetical protein